MVSRNASQEVIRAAFKSLCQKYHPDRNTHPNANHIIQQFNDSYTILSDPIERGKYDRLLAEYERNANKSKEENNYDYSNKDSHSSNQERQNKVVVINIPDSISFNAAKEKFRNFSSNVPDSTKSNIKELSNLIAKILIAVTITLIIFIVVLLIT